MGKMKQMLLMLNQFELVVASNLLRMLLLLKKCHLDFHATLKLSPCPLSCFSLFSLRIYSPLPRHFLLEFLISQRWISYTFHTVVCGSHQCSCCLRSEAPFVYIADACCSLGASHWPDVLIKIHVCQRNLSYSPFWRLSWCVSYVVYSSEWPDPIHFLKTIELAIICVSCSTFSQ